MENGAFSTETVVTSVLGERILVDGEGNRTIAPTQRPDGSYRKEIRIRPGFFRQEEQAKFISKGAEFRQRELAALTSSCPIGYVPTDDQPSEPALKSKKKRKPKKQCNLEGPSATVAEVQVEEFVLPSVETNEIDPTTAIHPVPKVDTVEASSSTAPTPSSQLPANRLKNVERTLKEIEILERKQRQGQGLAPAQIKKIERKNELEAELQCLKELLEALSLNSSDNTGIGDE